MIGSDCPVCTLSAGNQETMGIAQVYICHLPLDQQEWVFGGNGARFCGVE
jgi:hypothetical protein